MKKGLKLLFLFISFFLFINIISAKDVTLYLFYGETCPHCTQEKVFLQEMLDKYPELTIRKYEVWFDSGNNKLMKEKMKELDITKSGVPLTIVNDRYVVGYNETYKSTIEDMIVDAINEELPEEKEDDSTIYDLPILGKVNVKKVSLPIISIIMGLVDGFNPCAMWVLLFLISVLIGMKNKKRMWVLGVTFILTSGFIYLLIMMSWLELVVNIGLTTWIRYIIAAIAIIGSFINIRSFIKAKNDGCTIVDDKKRKKTFEKIKKFTSEKSFILALFGVITLAISVNLIELACSAGLPLIFTQILALNNINGIGALGYTLIYILFFLLDDLIIFIIAMITLKLSGISTKYTKYSHLIGGILMLIIGLLLIIKPDWIMFNF